VVKAREYFATKKTTELAKAQLKEQKKIQKAANTLKNKQLQELVAVLALPQASIS
jgi:hypothetical protein